ncbi:MAG: leucine-rich repeat domain-containing protein, partial [Acutalibacteraceae bacterium]|nr:leucine-rich repeat domain-containing protein [Acutalibacteraceae bacterium]
MIKKLLCTIGAIIAGTSVAACGETNEVHKDEPTQGATNISITEEENEIFENENYRFEKSDNGINLIEYIGYERDVIIPEFIEDEYVTSIEARCFSNTDNENIINSVTLSSYINDISPLAFYNSKFLQIINCHSNDNYLSENGILYTSDMEYLVAYPENKPDTEYIMPDTIKKIYNNAFSFCDNIETIKLSSSLEAIPDYAFAYNSSMSEIKVSESVKSIGYAAFFHCSGLKRLVLPHKDIE